jgi:hypothetical protein
MNNSPFVGGRNGGVLDTGFCHAVYDYPWGSRPARCAWDVALKVATIYCKWYNLKVVTASLSVGLTRTPIHRTLPRAVSAFPSTDSISQTEVTSLVLHPHISYVFSDFL